MALSQTSLHVSQLVSYMTLMSLFCSHTGNVVFTGREFTLVNGDNTRVFFSMYLLGDSYGRVVGNRVSKILEIEVILCCQSVVTFVHSYTHSINPMCIPGLFSHNPTDQRIASYIFSTAVGGVSEHLLILAMIEYLNVEQSRDSIVRHSSIVGRHRINMNLACMLCQVSFNHDLFQCLSMNLITLFLTFLGC